MRYLRGNCGLHTLSLQNTLCDWILQSFDLSEKLIRDCRTHPQLFPSRSFPGSESFHVNIICNLDRLRAPQIKSWFLFVGQFFPSFICFPSGFTKSNKKPGHTPQLFAWKSPQLNIRVHCWLSSAFHRTAGHTVLIWAGGWGAPEYHPFLQFPVRCPSSPPSGAGALTGSASSTRIATSIFMCFRYSSSCLCFLGRAFFWVLTGSPPIFLLRSVRGDPRFFASCLSEFFLPLPTVQLQSHFHLFRYLLQQMLLVLIAVVKNHPKCSGLEQHKFVMSKFCGSEVQRWAKIKRWAQLLSFLETLAESLFLFLYLFYLLSLSFFILATPCGVWNPSSLTGDQTCAPYIGSTES